jgi:hypothetical protein
MSAKFCKCGNETNEQDGVCVVCKFDIRLGRISDTPLRPPREGTELDAPIKSGHDKQNNGGERMATKEKSRCEVSGCPKGQWRDHRCMRHFNEKHGIERKKPGPKSKAKILPPRWPEIREYPPLPPYREKKSTTSVKSSIDMNTFVGLLTAKRDFLKEEIIKIEATFVTLHDYAGIDIPEMEFLNAG